MKFTIQHTTQKTIASLIIILMGLWMVNKAFFFHSHHFPVGNITTQARHYQVTDSSQPFQSQHHAKAAFFLFDPIQMIIFTRTFLFPFYQQTPKTLLYHCINRYIPDYFSNSRNRAPPYLFFQQASTLK